MKELIFNHFDFGRLWWSWKNWVCYQFLLWEAVVVFKELILNSYLLWDCVVVLKGTEFATSFHFGSAVVVMKELILNSLLLREGEWWSWKNWFWTVSTLKGCGGLERTDFEQFLLWDCVMVLKELVCYHFFFGVCGGLERTDFEQFPLWEAVVVMKGLILNSFYFGWVWWSWKNWFWTVIYFGSVWWSWKNWVWTFSTLGLCGDLKRTEFE